MENRFEISLVIPIPSGMYIGIEQDLNFCVIKNEKKFKKIRFFNKNPEQHLSQTPMDSDFQVDFKKLKKFVVFF
ncbi:hypothetical protein XMD564_001951 [Marinobacterium sp. xm-d-564]|nr:hypothetical protein [Marinobacterium sp. xm-d-564]